MYLCIDLSKTVWPKMWKQNRNHKKIKSIFGVYAYICHESLTFFRTRSPPSAAWIHPVSIPVVYVIMSGRCSHTVHVFRHIFHVESVIFQSVSEAVRNMWKSSNSLPAACFNQPAWLLLDVLYFSRFLLSQVILRFSVFPGWTQTRVTPAVESISPVSNTTSF